MHTDEVDLGDRAIWSVSSAKPGYGVAQLRDDSINTLWQFVHLMPLRFIVTTVVEAL